MIDTHELAWAAGFFDGEGHVSAARQRGHRATTPCVQIAQTDPRVLERFKAAVGGVGSVSGPKNYGRRDVWTYRTHRAEYVQAIIAMLWRFLSEVKRQDAAAALTAMRDWHAERMTTCRRGLHALAEVGLTTAGSCAECDRINRRTKYQAAHPPNAKSYCKSGEHELTPENTYVWNGNRRCRACTGRSTRLRRRQLVLAALQEDPERADRQLARLLRVSHKLVGTVRQEWEGQP